LYKGFSPTPLQPDVNHRECMDILGYTVQIPEDLNIEFTIYDICTAENISARKKRERKIEIANLQLNSELHSEGLLSLPGQLLVWKGLGDYEELHFGSYCRSKTLPYFITKSYMLQLQNMYFHGYEDKRDGRPPHGGFYWSIILDPRNMVVDGRISFWSENGDSN
jgi:hypothetical protein